MALGPGAGGGVGGGASASVAAQTVGPWEMGRTTVRLGRRMGQGSDGWGGVGARRMWPVRGEEGGRDLGGALAGDGVSSLRLSKPTAASRFQTAPVEKGLAEKHSIKRLIVAQCDSTGRDPKMAAECKEKK